MRTTAVLLLLALLCPTVRAAPASHRRDVSEIVRMREQMQAEYAEKVRARHHALVEAEKSSRTGSRGVPGWKGGNGGLASPGTLESPGARPDGSARHHTGAKGGEGSSSVRLPLLVVGGLIVLLLGLKVFAPVIFERRRYLPSGPTGAREPMTVKLRPRNQRMKQK